MRDAEQDNFDQSETEDISAGTPPLHWLDQILLCAECPNCGAARVGAYCADCGQKQLMARLRFGELIRSLLSRITAVEAGLFHTFWCLCLRPGSVAKDYIRGIQRPYVNPLTYFFLAATAQVLAFWSVQDILREQLGGQIEKQIEQSAQADANARIEQMLGTTLHEALTDAYLTAVTQSYSYAALIIFAIPFAFLLWLLHRWRGEPFRMGETIVFSLFTFSQILFYTAAMTPFTARIDASLHGVAALSIYIVVSQYAHGQFFSRTWPARVLTLLSMIIAWIPFLFSIVGFFIIAFIAKLLWAAAQGGNGPQL